MRRDITLPEIKIRHALAVGLSSPKIFFPAVACCWTVLKDFFLSQYHIKPKRLRQPVAKIDHSLDANIPFSPEWVDVYLRFSHMWVCSLSWLRYRYGKPAARYVVDTVRCYRHMYKEAAGVYKICQSTTDRPPVAPGYKAFKLIHRFDPHLNCLPSLHVMAVTYAAYRISRNMKELAGNNRDCAAEIEGLYEEARSITESILYIKQHSVNCIPAALFALKQLYPGVEEEFGKEFIGTLFKGTEPAVSDREETIRYMEELYGKFNSQWETGEYAGFQDVLLEFLAGYL